MLATPCGNSGPTVAVAITSDDQSQRLSVQPDIRFSSGNGGGNTIYVDEHETYQPIEGFGAAFTDSAAYLFNEVAPRSAGDAALSDLFRSASIPATGGWQRGRP